MAEISAFSANMLVFLDETGSDRRNSIRQFGYGLRGIPLLTHCTRITQSRGNSLCGINFSMSTRVGMPSGKSVNLPHLARSCSKMSVKPKRTY